MNSFGWTTEIEYVELKWTYYVFDHIPWLLL